jgi:hypothetical protein
MPGDDVGPSDLTDYGGRVAGHFCSFRYASKKTLAARIKQKRNRKSPII